jgi:hypothetical protein
VIIKIFTLGKNLQALKQELELDVHKITVDELCKRFNTNLERGLTKAAALEGNKKYGLNALTPPPTTPGLFPFYGSQWHVSFKGQRLVYTTVIIALS